MDGQKKTSIRVKYCGTVKKAPYFNPEKDAGIVYNSLCGVGNEYDDLIKVLSTRTNAQRQEILRSYSVVYGRDLMKDMKSETSGDFERILVALMQNPIEYDATCLYKAMKGLGTDEKTLTEILVTRSKDEMEKINNFYLKKYGHELSKDIREDVSGDYKKLLLRLASGSRERDDDVISTSLVHADAQTLRGIKHNHTDNSKYIELFSTRSFAHLRIALAEYERSADKEFVKVIESVFSGDFKDAVKAIVEVARYPPAFFAKSLHRSMKGAGTDDTTLVRIIVTRSEIDMADIKRSFREKYGKSLEWYIDDDTSGPYRKILNALI